MYGLFQTAFYFGYSGLGAVTIGIVCGEWALFGVFNITIVCLIRHIWVHWFLLFRTQDLHDS